MIRLSLCTLLMLAGTSAAQAPPSYAKHIQPFFTRYCVECHNRNDAAEGVNLESFAQVMKGGDKGAVLKPGKPDDSLLVQLLEGKAKPAMPPKKAKQPTRDEIALVRAWVAAGARDDSAAAKVVLPAIKAKAKVHPPIAAVAYAPSGKWLVAAGRGEVVVVDERHAVTRVKVGDDRVTALAISPKGTHLAVAAGGELTLWPIVSDRIENKPIVALRHADVIQDIAFSHDGKLLATASYDRLVKLYDVAQKKEVRTLKDHSDSVYGVVFSPDGKLLASGGADRAVKVWNVATGDRLYTLGESTDWVYGVAWHPDGKHLAAAGVDRSIRVWKVDESEGKVVHSVFAHEGAVLRLVYSADGKTLYSIGEDRAVKSWHADKMTERKVYDKQPEAILALGVRPDQKQLTLGRYDGALIQLETESGKVLAQPMPERPMPPVLAAMTPAQTVRGQTIDMTFTGKHLRGAQVVATLPGLSVTTVTASSDESLSIRAFLPTPTPPAVYQVRLKTEAGESASKPLLVDRYSPTNEAEPNDSARTSQKITLPATLVGALDRPGDLDWFRFDAKAGQEVGVQVQFRRDDPVLQLVDPDGEVVAESLNGLLGHVCKRDGVYALGIREREYRGSPDTGYRLHVGNIPIVTSVFPLGVQRGASVEVMLEGVNLGKTRTAKVSAPETAALGSRIPVTPPMNGEPALGVPAVVVGEFAEVINSGKLTPLAVPGTGNGTIDKPGATQTWRFAAKKGQRLILEVNARRIGSPLDSTLEILDGTGRPLPRAVLRCLARTYTVFRDHDSRSPGIRIEAWSELAIDDYLLCGNELLRIRALPRNPDDDCQFWTDNGMRLGYLGTTPVHVSQGTPMYKVSIHPPGSTFPPNGLPLVTLFWRNDDGDPRTDKDSRLVFDPPEDGLYQVRVGDSRGEGSAAHSYRLTVREPRPDFSVSFAPTAPTVSKGGATPIRVNLTRSDEFDGVVDVKLLNVPPGFDAPATNIPATDTSTAFALYASEKAVIPAKHPALVLEARARINGKEVVRTVTGSVPKLTGPGEISTSTQQSEVTLKPGGETRITVNIERRDAKIGRIPIEVQGLPHGVRVLDVGLNGILIIPGETTRTFVLYAEPWVQPMNHPIVVLAKREGTNRDHAAKSLLLKVTK